MELADLKKRLLSQQQEMRMLLLDMFDTFRQIAEKKYDDGIAVFNPEGEAALMENIKAATPPEYQVYISQIFAAVTQCGRNYQLKVYRDQDALQKQQLSQQENRFPNEELIEKQKKKTSGRKKAEGKSKDQKS